MRKNFRDLREIIGPDSPELQKYNEKAYFPASIRVKILSCKN